MKPLAAEESASREQKDPEKYALYLMRHGPAAVRDASKYPDDGERPLTADGRKRVREVADGLQAIDVELDWIVSSPLVRAADTAKIVAESFDPAVPLDYSDVLSPGGTPEALLDFLAKQPNRCQVMVVGHEPDLSDLAARLIGAARRAKLAFKKGGCCLIRFEEFPPRSAGELVWWLTPRILRKLG